MRFPRFVPFFICITLNTFSLFAQSPNGNINGLVSDPSSAAVVGAEVVAVNDVTGVQYTTKSNGEGIYVLPNLPPGPYRVQVSKIGFKTLIKPDIVLNVQDSLSINFTLLVGAFHEIVTVQGGAPLVNTESAAVSTVVDRGYIEQMPLNGRSFQDLILLTPGVVTNSPQSTATSGVSGEFSVNGQRTESNYYAVDGISANFGVAFGNFAAPGNSGSLPTSTALGTTQALVSVDALEEFRVQSSTYSAEFGRSPGGQFGFVTRSGTNQWHGTAFDYLRNDIFDANDWFNDYFRQPKAPLRQNDFGGTLGGPVSIPGLYNGKGKTFFFFSYEALRLIQPQAASVTYVPTLALRQSSSGALQSALNAFPLPNCPSSATNCTNDLGDGMGQFIGTWSNPSSIDSYSIRLDHAMRERIKLFVRLSSTPSYQRTRLGGPGLPPPSEMFVATPNTRTATFGAITELSNSVVNDFRLGYSSSENTGSSRMDTFGGAQPVDIAQLEGLTAPITDSQLFLYFSNFSHNAAVIDSHAQSSERQWNLVDSTSWSFGKHSLKFGVDYRRLASSQQYDRTRIVYSYLDAQSVQTNSPASVSAQSNAPYYPHFVNFSSFAQDEWRATNRLALSLGLRWEVNPAPSAPRGNLPYTILGNINDPATLTLAPQGTSLWHTSWHNFAPRFGVAYALRGGSGFETVLRGGAGMFFDTGQQLGTQGYGGPGFSGTAVYCAPPACAEPGSFPLNPSQSSPAIVNPPVPPYGTVYGADPHLQLPFTIQWNVSVEQAFGDSQALTVSYVGANGRRLLEFSGVGTPTNPNMSLVVYVRNGLTSDYNALQVRYQRRLSHGLQALASYTWSHSVDYGSSDEALPYMRGNSDFDVRHNFSAAVSYSLPNLRRSLFAGALLNNWGLDARMTARTGFPVTLAGNLFLDPTTLQYFNGGLDVVPGVPLYLYGSQCLQSPPQGFGAPCPGGRAINPNAFALPPSDRFGDAPRNFTRGFGAWQLDLAVRREFPIRDRLKLQFRAEGFNIFNHPNFGTINPSYCSPGPFCTFGQATSTLAQSLGVLSPLYQMGGPRSMQVSLKLMF